MENSKPVLVVGATGNLGGKVVKQLLALGKTVHALVRPASDASKLEAQGVVIKRGDMMDPSSLTEAMYGADAVITTANGYMKHSKGDTDDIDTLGNRNLVDAAKQTGIRRFVLTSILTCDQTPQVPHFWHKKLVEDYLEEKQVPFVALRPGAFVDGMITAEGPDGHVRIMWMGNKETAFTIVLTSQIARYLAEAVDAPGVAGQKIDIGWQNPVMLLELEKTVEKILHQDVGVLRIPNALISVAGVVGGLFSPLIKDMAAMGEWMATGKYVANTTRQAQIFDVPTVEESLRELFAERGYHLSAGQ